MKRTRQPLPLPVLNFVNRKNTGYKPSTDRDFYNTELPQPARMRWIKNKHKDEIKHDPADFLFAVLGDAVHHIMEKGAEGEESLMAEHRLLVEAAGYLVSSRLDLYDRENKILYDYKVTSVWKLKESEPPIDWVRELNVSALGLKQDGYEVKAVKLVMFLRDWNQSWAKKNKDLDVGQICTIDAPLWTVEEAEAYIKERGDIHKRTDKIEEEEDLPLCTDEEMWARPTVWAHMRKGRVTAVKLHETKSACERSIAADPKGGYVEERKGHRVRCADYCDAAPWCSQYRTWRESL
jgi:hypothetical protein